MDEIQRVLINAGRKDLAQKYYKKIAVDLDIDKFTGYEKLKQTFNYKGIRIGSYDVEQDGNDFDGFEVQIDGILSNGLEFSYSHLMTGDGEFKVRTRKKTEFLKEEFNLQEIGAGYSDVLEAKLKKVLDFNF